MTRQEKLERIVAKIDELLETASNRTPSKWEVTVNPNLPIRSIKTAVFKDENETPIRCFISGEAFKCDAQFIAACAGPAEAGWNATKAAIPWFVAIAAISDDSHNDATRALDEIIAAWEGIV